MIKDFSRNARWNNFMKTLRMVNGMLKEIKGQEIKGLEMEPKHNGSFFTINDPKNPWYGDKVRINSSIPSQEIFSLAQELVLPMDEPFALRKIFQIDSSFAPGSREIGFDVKADRGRARLTSMTNTSGDNIPKSDMSIGRNLQAVGKIDTYIEVTRDESQEIELRNDRGMGPLVDLMSGKLETARKSVNRVEDQLGFQGGSFDDAQVDGEILGYFDSFSTDSALFLGDNPSKGKREDIPGGSLKWTDPLKTPEEFISDLKPALQYLTRNNAYKPRAFGLPPEILSCLIMKKVSPADSTPLLTWLIQTINAGYGVDLQVFTTNALTFFENSGTTNGFVLLDNSKSNMAIGSVEEIIMLPPVIDKTQTTEQVVQLKTGGMQVKQPASGYLGTDI